MGRFLQTVGILELGRFHYKARAVHGPEVAFPVERHVIVKLTGIMEQRQGFVVFGGRKERHPFAKSEVGQEMSLGSHRGLRRNLIDKLEEFLN